MIANAIVRDAALSMEDYGCLYFYFVLEGNGWTGRFGDRTIGIGGLTCPPEQLQGHGIGLTAMMRIMQICGVDRWEKVPGRYVRVQTDGWPQNGVNVNKIGNIIFEDWLDLNKHFEMKGETNNGSDNRNTDNYNSRDAASGGVSAAADREVADRDGEEGEYLSDDETE